MCYAALNTIVRLLSGGAENSWVQPLPVNMILFIQDFFALLIISPWLFSQMKSAPRPRFIGLHTLRVIFSAIGIIAWYFALSYLPQADAVALSIIGPIIGVIVAKYFLKEQLKPLKLIAIVLTFAGAYILIKPFNVLSHQLHNETGLICVLLSAVGFALAKVFTRKLASLGESRQLLTAYLLLMMVPVTIVPALLVWVTPSFDQILWLMLGGLMTVLAIYAVSSALAYAEVSFLAPFDCMQFILNVSIGYFLFTELPASWASGLVVMAFLFTMVTVKLRSST